MISRETGPDLRSYAFLTLGCKSNQYDSAALAADLAGCGLVPAHLSEADLVIVNTCAVTAEAESQGRQAVRRARRDNPGAFLVAAGCMARRPDSRDALPGADLVLAPEEKGGLLARLGVPGNGWEDWPADPAVDMTGRDRPFLKVQDGCGEGCAFCVVPLVRGRSRSLPFDRALSALHAFMTGGQREVVLTGIHLGFYGRDLSPPRTLEDLLEEFLASRLPGRLRLSSLEATEVTDRLLSLLASSGGRICRHLHIPLQSGSDRILSAMGRRGRRADFLRAAGLAREQVPGIGVGSDVIVGFPGETREDFAETLDLLTELAVPFLHVFPYSPRRGTPAASLADDMPAAEKRNRVRLIREGAAHSRRLFLESMAGAALIVVPEGRRDPAGRIPALADNYARVLIGDGEALVPGELARVRVLAQEGESLLAEVEGSRE